MELVRYATHAQHSTGFQPEPVSPSKTKTQDTSLERLEVEEATLVNFFKKIVTFRCFKTIRPTTAACLLDVKKSLVDKSGVVGVRGKSRGARLALRSKLINKTALTSTQRLSGSPVRRCDLQKTHKEFRCGATAFGWLNHFFAANKLATP